MRNVNTSLKNGIDEWGHGGALTQHDKATKQNHHNNNNVSETKHLGFASPGM